MENNLHIGAERTIKMEINITKKKKNTEMKIRHFAEILSTHLSFENVNNFNNDVDKINKMILTAAKNGSYVEMDIVRFDYMPDKYISSGKMLDFNRWAYSGYPQNDFYGLEKNEQGLYFVADKRYTPSHHDMYYDFTLSSITT